MQQHGSEYFNRRFDLPPSPPHGYVAYQIKGTEEHRAPFQHIFSPNTHPQLVGWIQR